jgi:hypothetical protein
LPGLAIYLDGTPAKIPHLLSVAFNTENTMSKRLGLGRAELLEPDYDWWKRGRAFEKGS